MSIFSFLNPFASAASKDVTAAIKAIQDKANSDIAAVRANAARASQTQTIAAKRANLDALVADYKAMLAQQAAVAPAGASGPTLVLAPATPAPGPTGSAPPAA